MKTEDERIVETFTRRETELERKRRIRRKVVDTDRAAAIREAIEAVPRPRAPQQSHRPRLVHVAFILTACEAVKVDVVKIAIQGLLIDIGAGARAVASVTVTALPTPVPPELTPTPAGRAS